MSVMHLPAGLEERHNGAHTVRLPWVRNNGAHTARLPWVREQQCTYCSSPMCEREQQCTYCPSPMCERGNNGAHTAPSPMCERRENGAHTARLPCVRRKNGAHTARLPCVRLFSILWEKQGRTGQETRYREEWCTRRSSLTSGNRREINVSYAQTPL